MGKTVNINVPPGTYALTVGGTPPMPLSVTDTAGVQITGTGAGVAITNSGATGDIIETDQNRPGAGGFPLARQRDDQWQPWWRPDRQTPQ